MKNTLKILALITAAVIVMMAMTSCNNEEEGNSNTNTNTNTGTDTVCKNHTYSDNYEITADGHTYKCVNENCTNTRVETHEFGAAETATAPTCETNGINKMTCSVCNYTKDITIDALGHTYAKEYATNETHHWFPCKNCDAKSEEAEHAFDTFKNDNHNHWYECLCGDKFEITPHTWNDVSNGDGTTTRTCTDQNCKFSLTIEDNPGHECTFTDGEVLKQPTCTEEGIQQIVCTCGNYDTKPISKKPHDFGADYVIEDGYKIYTCICGETQKVAAGGYIDPEGWT